MEGPRAKMKERRGLERAGRPATAAPRAKCRGPARGRELARVFFFAEAQPKRRRFGWVSAKKKEKGWSSRWASNGYFQPSIALSLGSRCPTATWAINFFFML